MPVLSASHSSFYGIAYAEIRPQLIEGMSYFDVLSRWGSPVEKIEYETKREARWVYTNDSVNFKNGKVTQIALITDPWELKIKQAQPEKANPKAKANDADDSALIEIFEEIAKGYPDTDSDSEKDNETKKPKILENKSRQVR
ncbi:MAG: hypothetical protein KDD56_00875 [Bdellovibrionales bacterium]|nr:hypothetical protein [Bdellovibrionales bacterium]